MLPKKVRLGPYTYTIETDQAAFDAIQVKDGMKLCGRQELETQTIHVNPRMARDATCDTIIHESLHHFFAVSSLRQSDWYSSEAEEGIVNTLAPCLLALLRDNPKLVSELCAS